MNRFWVGLFVGLVCGAGVGFAGFFTMSDQMMIHTAFNQRDLYVNANNISSRAFARMASTSNPAEVTQIASELSALLEFAQVKQNDMMLQKLDSLIEEMKKR